MKNILYCSLYLLLAACSSPNPRAEQTSDLTPTSGSTITHKTKLTNFAIIPSINPDPITDAELDQVADLLQLCVTEYNVMTGRDFEASNKLYGNAAIDLTLYRKQLVVSVNSKGVKSVWVNCFCEWDYEEFPNWKKEINREGSSNANCAFDVRLNLTERTWDKLDMKYTLF
ncbi:hypothetical protein [Hymenobacter cellulosilyticus]|uniref:Lipoprotein n=1 Tax=Hymenobacter cellulosilyticus TaxID=2932248 RepID=A0A8T9PZW2_9BACT|nr:hypothetical protein [Hymenobacter cellulosilyticus]UOQ70657.1 hypothetical protein MUN79_18365 [Hymenobacter cellulosilyticus]